MNASKCFFLLDLKISSGQGKMNFPCPFFNGKTVVTTFDMINIFGDRAVLI